MAKCVNPNNAETESEHKESLQAVDMVSLDGDAVSIINSLTSLMTIVQTNKSGFLGGLFSSNSKELNKALKTVRSAAIEKMKIGIIILRGKGAVSNAEPFEWFIKYTEFKAGLPIYVAVALAVVLACIGFFGNIFAKYVF